MKKSIIFIVGLSVLFLGGCVEKSQKYQSLQARLDSLNSIHNAQNAEMEEMFAGLNEISSGIQALREAEQLLTLEAQKETKSGTKSKQQIDRLKNDVQSLAAAITMYKEQVANLEKRGQKNSAEYKKLIANLNQELEVRNQKIEELTNQLNERTQQLAQKTQQVTDLTKNVEDLNKETASQKMTIAEQDQAMNVGNYLVGDRKTLKEANVISRQGIFCPPIVSSQAQAANFKTIDVREVKEIPLNSKKAKVLSAHPENSYSLQADGEGMLVLKINDEANFWKQVKYLVVMAN